MKKTIKDLDLKGKKVLIRVDFNVPIKNGVITSNKRILAALPTISYALEQGAKVILLSHLGRVKTNEDKKGKSLKIVAEELSKQLRQRVIFVPETRGKVLEQKIKEMQPKDVLMIENTRFEDLHNSAESKNSPELGKYWASLGDIFINDAFGTTHRAHASNVGISKHIKESAIGFLVQEELSMLAKALYGNKRPFVAIIGGAKITDKIKVIDNLIDKVDYLIIGGGMAYTFCASQGLSIGNSLVEPDKVELARNYMKKYSHKIILPVDSAVSINYSNNYPLYNKDNSLEIPEGYMGLDIGPRSIKVFRNVLAGAKTVLWNGPMGVAEFDNYKIGTESVANIIASQPGVFSIIGGGDSAAAVINLGLERKFSYISTGGGASLQFMEGGVLPGVESIQEAIKRNLEETRPVITGQPVPIVKPGQPVPIVKPGQPVPITKPGQPVPIVKPGQPVPITKPGQPVPI
ncbi:MAG: phosphoglycerate kinase, partial [Metamycoplasmataceae bacterium]